MMMMMRKRKQSPSSLILIELLLAIVVVLLLLPSQQIIIIPSAAAFSISSIRHGSEHHPMISPHLSSLRRRCFAPIQRTAYSRLAMASSPPHEKEAEDIIVSWSPQDLTKDNNNFIPIPNDDYVKQYQKDPNALWPVEFFVVAYRRRHHDNKIQILVRKSANGTSKWGLGTGVPVTRWMMMPLSKEQQQQPPFGYQWSKPKTTFEASNFPEFPKKNGETPSWTYQKIDIREDAFKNHHADYDYLKDSELEQYAKKIRNELKAELNKRQQQSSSSGSSWESIRNSVVQNVLDNPNSVAAIQGTFRMSGIRIFDNNSADPAKIAKSTRIYTMFPQMPDPMPLPSTPPEELRNEIVTRPSRMATETGRDPHKDKYGRVYTHISTSNVSNTIHGIYLPLDLTTGVYGDDDAVPTAFDLFGNKAIEREWKSLEELMVLSDGDGKSGICTKDPKSTFISGFIVRQLIKDGVIH